MNRNETAHPDTDTREMPDKPSKTFNLTLTQVAAAALAAVTAAALGSRLGVAGTVLGAALASAVSTIAGAVYQHSLERSRARIHSVQRRRGDDATTDATTDATDAVTDLEPDADVIAGAPRSRPSRRFAIAAGALAAFGLALLAVTGLEAVRGAPLSGGDGTTVGRVLGGDAASRPEPPLAPSQTSGTQPSSTPPAPGPQPSSPSVTPPLSTTTPVPTPTTTSNSPTSSAPGTSTNSEIG